MQLSTMSKLRMTIECATDDTLASLEVWCDESKVHDLCKLSKTERNTIQGTLRAYIELMDSIR